MPRAGAVWVDVLPNMSNFGRSLDQQIGEPVARATARAGADGGESMLASMGGKLKAGGAAVGLALGAAVAKGTQLAMEKAAAGGKLKGQLGLSAKDAQAAGNAAGRLYANAVTESIEDGATAVRAIMSAGLAPEGATTKQLANIATKAQDLSTLFEVDLGQAANAAGQAVKTGLADNATEAFDAMTRGFQVMGPRADDLMDTFNEYSTIFRALGLDIQTATGLFSQGMRNGARDTDVVADALKEFQIRSTDGSAASAAGFKALGLNAKQMTAQMAAGGKGAASGLQTVLDRLRGMKDPVQRNTAAVALFGTKAEDMAQALYSLDPSKAVSDLGKVSGAAKQAGDDLRANAGTQFEQFKRRALMALGDAVGKYALPALLRLGTFLNRDVLPPVKSVAGVLQRTLVPAVKGVASAIAGGARWFQQYGAWLTPLAVVIGGLTLALSANAIATAAVTAVFSVYRAAILLGTAVTNGLAIAQAALNAVMALNPFVLVAIAVVALGAALAVAWQKSQTFRSVVMAAWQGIQAVAMAAWSGFIKPAIDGFMIGLRALGAAAVWLWRSILQPAFNGIALAARILATVITVAFALPIVLAFKLVATVGTWLWRVAVGPALRGIGAGAMWLYRAAILPMVAGASAAFRALGAAGVWLWKNAISPAMHGAGAAAMWLYRSAVLPMVTGAKAALHALGAAGTWLWKNAVSPAFHGIGSLATWLYNKGIKPPLDLGKKAAHALGEAFRSAKDTIGTQFGKVADLAKRPIEFVIDVVYNKGILGVWNRVAGAFGAPKLSKFKGFASGGVLPGYTPGRDVHRFYSPTGGGLDLSGGESIMRPEFTRAVGAGGVGYLNRLAQSGGVRAVRAALAPALGGQPTQAYAGGGIFGWVGKKLAGAGSAVWNKVKQGTAWLKDTLAASARAGVNAVVKPLLSRLPGADTAFGKMALNLPNRMIDALFGYADTADKKGASKSFGGGKIPRGQHRAIISQALAAAHIPPPGTEAQWLSGLNTLISRESGWNASAINNWDVNAKNGIPSQGLAQVIPPTFNANVPKSLARRGILDPVANVAAAAVYIKRRYGNITNVQQADASKSPKGYAAGGTPRPGEIAWVGERGPELVRFRGGEEVYNHATSMRMAAGLTARGFAKGTTAAQARKDIPGDLTKFTKSLTGSASSIAAATKELIKDLKAAGGAGKSLAISTAKASIKLQGMAKQRDAIAAKIDTARQAAKDQKGTAADYLGLSNLSDATSVGDVISGMRDRQGTLSSFQAQITKLSKAGLNQSLIQQLVAMGPDSALAGIVSNANPGQIKQLNALAKSGAKLSTKYGASMADAMYDAGGSASKGFLAGLLAEEKALQAAMAKIGRDAVKAIRSKKGIDAHSPSRKGAQAGQDLGAGLIAGMVATAPAVASAAERLGATAVPGGVVPVTSSSSSGGQASSLDGRPLFLVVEDGTVLRAYVDDRVDAGLGDVRRSSRAGSKKR